jgi:hypothetical protein
MAGTTANVNKYLSELMKNGKAEVGLEVGADPGLSPSEYIKIPKSMTRDVSGKFGGKAGSSSATTTGGSTNWVPGDVYIVNGKVHRVKSTGAIGEELDSFVVPDPVSWADDIRKFVAANEQSVRSSELTEDLIKMVHAVRYWSVIAGFVTTSKSREYTVVDTPSTTETSAVTDETVEFISKYHGQAWTACVARTASWRKSNHATGGQGGPGSGVATGFARRWLSREGYWTQSQDQRASYTANQRATTAFYIATHATSVHAVLAQTVGDDKHHWAKVDPSYGCFSPDVWDLRDSAKLRIAPRTQVAGTSMVTDAVVVMKMLISEGIAGLLTERGGSQRLADAYGMIEREGMRLATYAGWYFDGHPHNVSKGSFSQKDPAYASLVGELGVVATTYYRGSTIGDSPSLASAAAQLATPSSKTTWAQLTRVKTSSVSPALVAAYGRVTGAVSAAAVEDITSTERDRVEVGVTSYNDATALFAKQFGVSDYTKVTVDAVIANAKAADARAEMMASAGRSN